MKLSSFHNTLKKFIVAECGRAGIAMPGDIYMVSPGGGAPETYWSSRLPSNAMRPTIAEAEAELTSLHNDVVFLTPENHTQGEGIVWNTNMNHLVGLTNQGYIAHRARIGHNADFDALITVSGWGNSFHNIYTMHGRGSATNLHALELTGDRNSFFNCHFAGPLHATESGTATYATVTLNSGAESYFKNCTLGADTIARSAANRILYIEGANATRTVFEDCIFLSSSSAGTPYMIEVAAAATYGWTLFKNCQFINFSSSWASPLTVAVAYGPSAAQHRLIFDSRCSFYGCTDIIAAADEGEVLVGNVPYIAAATGNLLNSNPDVS